MTADTRLRVTTADASALAALASGGGPPLALGLARLALGEHAAAAACFEAALRAARGPDEVVAARIGLADALRYGGDAMTAGTLYEYTAELARREAPALLPYALRQQGLALAELGRLGAARERLAEALALRIGDPSGAAAALEAIEDPGFPLPLPPSVLALVGHDAVWDHDGHGGASGSLAHVAGRYYVRRGPQAEAEHERLSWLRRWSRVPEVALFEDGVLVTADAGLPSLEDAGDGRAAEVGELMGRTLRALHALPVAECPFDGRLDVTLARAGHNVLRGLVDPDDFDDDNAGRTPQDVLDELRAARPAVEDLVVAHGDFTPGNVLEGGMLLDVGGLGVADRYRDLAIAVRDLDGDFGQAAVTAFRSAYGLTGFDDERLRYYRLLDELF
ncbi:aminoglycoside 3'-phosphotransferase [Nonomuraea longicatena]|uniref:aminoglycoside 3'-phosphotransferase n=1 Tax=Nonomuraea longicatena TaxID=83682 RepID=UPI0031E0DE54